MRYLILIMAVAVLTSGVFTACQTAASQQQSNNQEASPIPPPKQETENDMKRISVEEAKAAFDAGNVVIVDTRNKEQYRQEHIKGAVNIPANEFEKRFQELPAGKQIIAYCS